MQLKITLKTVKISKNFLSVYKINEKAFKSFSKSFKKLNLFIILKLDKSKNITKTKKFKRRFIG